MSNNALITGAALIVLGAVVTVASDSDSITSWIPAFVGVAFIVVGVGARFLPDLGHHFMHVGAALAAVGILGSLGSVIGRGSGGWALFSQLATILILGGFLYLAVQSFRAARKARDSAAVA